LKRLFGTLGGNQQKVVMARALLSNPVMVLADEPTQGVDVGARLELYDILRKASADGIPVVVASSDAKELEGLCDTVYVLSRGQVVKTLHDGENREEAMIEAAVTSTTKVIRLEREVREQKLGTRPLSKSSADSSEATMRRRHAGLGDARSGSNNPARKLDISR